MSEKIPADGLIKSLKSLVTIEHVILLLSFAVATNIVLVRGLHQTIAQVSWETFSKNVSLLEFLFFLCLFGLYMTSGAGLLVILRGWLLQILEYLFNWPLSWIESRKNSKVRDYSVWVISLDVLKKANRDSDSYYGAVYERHQQILREEWRLSSDATACIVLMIYDFIINQHDSAITFIYQAFLTIIPKWIALVILGSIALLLILIVWEPYRGDDNVIYCPGFPEEDNSAVPKNRQID